MKNEKKDLHGKEHKSNEIKIERPDSKKENSGNGETNEKDMQGKGIEKLKDELSAANSEIEKLKKEIEDYKDKLLRKAAEFENYKRRTENDQLNLIKYAAENFIVKLLPTVDDFERSLQHIDSAKDVESIKEGIKLVYDKLMKTLIDQGITKIDSKGKPFDVHFHEALLQRPAENVPPHTVLEEVEKGYMYKDRVIRHAKVIVSLESDNENLNSEVDNTNHEDK